MRFGIIVGPKLHRTRTKRFTPTYLCDKPSRPPWQIGNLATWQLGNLAHPLIFISRKKKGPLFQGPADTNCRSFRKAFLLVGARTLFG